MRVSTPSFASLNPVPDMWVKIGSEKVINQIACITELIQSENASTVVARGCGATYSKYPPAKPGALGCEPLKAAMRSLTRPRVLGAT